MNRQLLDPFELEYPEEIEACVDDEYATTCKFNRRGNYLATTRSDGFCWIWDIETLSPILKLFHSIHPVTCVSWSKNGRYLLTADEEGLCIVWDLKKKAHLLKVELSHPIIDAKMCQSKRPSFIACPAKSSPVIVEYTNAGLPPILHYITLGATSLSISSGEPPNNVPSGLYATCCGIEPRSRYVYFGTNKGLLLAVSISNRTTIGSTKLCPSAIKSINMNFRKNELVLNVNDRILRVISATENIDSDTENIKVEFNVLAKIQDHVNRVQWSQACFSSSGEFVVAGSCHRAEHHIYVWDKISGSLVKMLTGPHELLEDISVHPIRPIFASISTFGMIYMWTRKPQQNWSAFAPGFRELEENIDYSEPETEFDKNPTSTKNKLDSKDDSMKDMGEEVDIMGCDPLFSDSDASDSDKLDHIPMTPTYDIDYEHYNVDNKDEDQNSNIDVEGSMPDKNTSSAQSDVMKDSFSINNTVEIGEVNPSTNVPPNEAYNTKAEFGDNKPLTPLHPTQDIKTDGQPNPPEKNASTEIMIKDLLN